MSLTPTSTPLSAGLESANELLSHRYTLRSDLAKLSLPSGIMDENRKLAWVNSICFLFLVIGLIGLNPRKLTPRTLEQSVDAVPVVFTPPVEPPKVQPEPQLQEPDPNQDVALETPQIATVVAADPTAVNFPVQVDGPVTFAPARFAAAPPPTPPKPAQPKPTVFNASRSQGAFPDPPYPSLALRRHYEGKLLLYVVVDPAGAPSSIQVKESSGFNLLDDHSAEWVKNRWRWPQGDTRHYLVPFHYQIR
ncbi:MAG: TonB family protein [Verrucomicrobia bacterium]|nr:TonB family protein [Verrucomicrobiota bacterium]